MADPVEDQSVCRHPDLPQESFQMSPLHSMATELPTAGQLWEIRPSPGKGLGMFATRPVPKGAIIMEEAPLFTISPPDHYVSDSDFIFNEMIRLADAAVEELTDEQKAMFHGLRQYRYPQEPARGENFYILRTNAYTVDKFDWGFFPQIVRLNHSCQPNVMTVWTVTRGQGRKVVWATRDIEAGEEILTSYVSLLQNKEARNYKLSQYGFVCDCRACTEEDEAQDYRRTVLNRSLAHLQRVLDAKGWPGALKPGWEHERLLEDAMKLARALEEIDLVAYHACAYRLVAQYAYRLKKMDLATEWATRELAMYRMVDAQSTMSLAAEDFIKKLEDIKAAQVQKSGAKPETPIHD